MSFLVQWVVYLAAFVAGSAVAYGIAAVLIKPRRPESESAPVSAEPEFAEPETMALQSMPEISQSAPTSEIETAPEPQLPVPVPASAGQEGETFEQLLWPESQEPPAEVAERAEGAGAPELGPESVAPEPEPEPEVAEVAEAEPELVQPQWPGAASQWPGLETRDAEEAEPVAEVLEPEPEPEPELEPEVAQVAEPEPELAQPQWPGPASQWPGPDKSESEDAASSDPEPETPLPQPQWPGPPSQWPGIGVKR